MPRIRHPKSVPKKETLLECWKRLNPNKPLEEYDKLIMSVGYYEALCYISGQLVVKPFREAIDKHYTVYLWRLPERR